MDRPTSTTAAFAALVPELSATGWDPHTVWRERVRAPHAGSHKAGSIVLAEPTTGWDPHETWRLRVRGPRARRG
jgi:hypothetical protein